MHYYLIINEGINNGLIDSQILNPITYNSLEEQVGVISIEKPGSAIRKNHKLHIRTIPLGIPYRLFLFNSLAFFLVPVLAFSYAVLLSFITSSRDVLIARSYFPGLVLYYLKKIRGGEYKFDPRSLFIQESTTKGLLNEGSRLYRKWIQWERKILSKATLIVVVAEKQREYYEKSMERALPITNIPCYSSQHSPTQEDRQTLLPFGSSDLIVVYYGSLDNGWNNKEIYSLVFRKLIDNGYKICIISQNYKDLVKDSRFSRSEIFIVNTLKDRDFAKYLGVCDYGIIVMSRTADWETRLGVKFVEYLSSGLGVLVGEHVGEAVRLSEKYFNKYTFIVKDDDFLQVALSPLNCEDRTEIRRKANELFGPGNFKKVIYN